MLFNISKNNNIVDETQNPSPVVFLALEPILKLWIGRQGKAWTVRGAVVNERQSKVSNAGWAAEAHFETVPGIQQLIL